MNNFYNLNKFSKATKIAIHDKKKRKMMIGLIVVICVFLVTTMMCQDTYAAGNVSGVIESAWNSAESQIKNVVNNVVFPVIDLVLAVFFFVKLGTAYFDYRKQGQFEWTAPAILFACLCFTLTALNYIWNIL